MPPLTWKALSARLGNLDLHFREQWEALGGVGEGRRPKTEGFLAGKERASLMPTLGIHCPALHVSIISVAIPASDHLDGN